MFKRAPVTPPPAGLAAKARQPTARQQAGRDAEDRALAHLQAQGLRLVERNYRVARGPAARGGEIDLVMRDRDGTLVFVEVRARRDTGHGGAAASISPAKQRALQLAAEHYLLRFPTLPACRFDVVAVDGGAVAWLPGAWLPGA